ncbi:hypothetical protein [Spirillospora sp. NPDC029432]
MHPDSSEIAWHSWLAPAELRAAIREMTFVPDALEAFDRYRALDVPPADA